MYSGVLYVSSSPSVPDVGTPAASNKRVRTSFMLVSKPQLIPIIAKSGRPVTTPVKAEVTPAAALRRDISFSSPRN